jgi:hypothetical protein
VQEFYERLGVVRKLGKYRVFAVVEEKHRRLVP